MASTQEGTTESTPYPAPQTTVGEPEPTELTEGTPVDAAAWSSQVAGTTVVLVDDWKAANDSGDPESYVDVNRAVSDNAMTIQTSTLERPQQAWSIDLAYGISAPAPNDYVGFDRDLPQLQDWSAADQALIDVDATRAPGVTFVFQFWEASGEVWRYSVPVTDLAAGEPLTVALDSQHFERAAWSTRDNDAIDLGAIKTYGVYVGHTGPGRAGSITLGAIAVHGATSPTP